MADKDIIEQTLEDEGLRSKLSEVGIDPDATFTPPEEPSK